MTKIEIYRNKKREWCWRAKRNGRIVADGGEGYRRVGPLYGALRGLFKSIAENKVRVFMGKEEVTF